MDAALRALAEPNRRRILEIVGSAEMSAGEIASHFEITRPAISQHLTALKGAGLLSERRQGTKRLYRVRADGMTELRIFLEGFWTAKLDQLKAAAEEAEAKGGRR